MCSRRLSRAQIPSICVSPVVLALSQGARWAHHIHALAIRKWEKAGRRLPRKAVLELTRLTVTLVCERELSRVTAPSHAQGNVSSWATCGSSKAQGMLQKGPRGDWMLGDS